MKGCEGELIAAALKADGDSVVRNKIFMIDGIIFVVLAVYSLVWCRTKLKRKLFTPIPIHEVMAMENQHKD